MSNIFHDTYVGSNIHAFTANPNSTGVGYADIAARDADTAFHSDPRNINKVIRVNTPLSYFILVDNVPTWENIGSSLANSFIGDVDTPGTYVGQGRKLLAVNPAENAVEFPGLSYIRNSKTVQVFTEADFPTPVGDVITLINDTTYEINDNISMANRFELPDSSAILFRTKRSNNIILTYTGTGEFFSNAPGGIGIADFELDDMLINISDTVSARLFNLKGNKQFQTTFVCNNFQFNGKRVGLIENFGVIGINFSDFAGTDEEGIDFFNCQFHTYFNTSVSGSLAPATGTATLITIRGPATTQCLYLNILAFPLTNLQRTLYIAPDINPSTEMEIDRLFSAPVGRYFELRETGEFTSITQTLAVATVTGVIGFGPNPFGLDALFLTAAAHGFVTGDQITHTGFPGAGFGATYNGNYIVIFESLTSYKVQILDFNPFRDLTFFFIGDATGTATKDYSNFITTNTTGLVVGEGVKITDTIQNDQIYIIRELVLNTSFSVSKTFTISEPGKWNIGSLDEKDMRVTLTNSGFQKESRTIALGALNANPNLTDINTAGANTYIPLVVTNFASNIVTERFILTDANSGQFTFDGLTPFQGLLTGSLGALKSGGTVNYRFAMSLNGGIPLFTAIGSTAIATITENLVTGLAQFNHGGTSPPVGGIADLSGFDVNRNYNRKGLVLVSSAFSFECSEILFNGDDTGNFTAPLANYEPMEVKTTKVIIPLIFSADLRPRDTIQVMVAGDGTSDNLTITDIGFGLTR